MGSAVAVWFIPYRAPLWLDETVSYWEISGGFGQIWSRTVAGMSFPPYFYLLWATRELFGNREVVLRIPSVIAMLAAVYVVFRIAREFFHPDVAFIVCILFCLHKDVAFAAIDARPYAFAVLATNLAIYALLLWLRQPDTFRSVMLGASCALIFYFQYLYGVILPGFVLCYFLARGRQWRNDLRQIAVVLSVFVVMFLPVVGRLHYIFSLRSGYHFEPTPTIRDFLIALTPTPFVLNTTLLGVTLATLFLALLFWIIRPAERRSYRGPLFSISLGMVPIALLFVVSSVSSMSAFSERYRLVGVTGVVLLWGFLFSLIPSIHLRLPFALALVPFALLALWNYPGTHRHGYSWKYALEYAQFVAEPDNAPLLICSDFPQSDVEPMPTGPASESVLFAQLSYYKVTVPVVPLPRALTDEAKLRGSTMLRQSAQKQQRFLALAFGPSYPTVEWLMEQSAQSHSSQLLGGFDGIGVVEFRPLAAPAQAHAASNFPNSLGAPRP